MGRRVVVVQKHTGSGQQLRKDQHRDLVLEEHYSLAGRLWDTARHIGRLVQQLHLLEVPENLVANMDGGL